MGHFQRYEFRDPSSGDEFVRPLLIVRLERLRELVGQPLRIVSGYRCPAHNRAIGGAHDSQHVYAAAADLEVGKVKLAQAIDAGFTGVGTKGAWVTHVDVRDGAFRHWTYPE